MTPRPRLLALNEVEISLTVKQDDQPVRGAFGSDEPDLDREMEDEILSRLDAGDVWAWCDVTVRVTWKGYVGEAYLCGCSYRDEDDFVNQDYYYPAMVDEALETLNSAINEAHNTLQVLCQ